MSRIGKPKVLQLLSRVWSGPNGVLAGKQAEQKMIDILRNKFPKAQIIEVTDVSGIFFNLLHSSFQISSGCSKKSWKIPKELNSSVLHYFYEISVGSINSGGCGAMFHINVVAPEFKGLNTVKQHRMINDVSISESFKPRFLKPKPQFISRMSSISGLMRRIKINIKSRNMNLCKDYRHVK